MTTNDGPSHSALRIPHFALGTSPEPVPWVADLEPAIHGSWEPTSPKGSQPCPVIDFSANGNVIGPPPGVAGAIASVPLDRYPERDAATLRRALAAHHQLGPEMVVAGNGSSELIWAIARAYLAPGARSLVLGPTYGEYGVAARAAGAEVREVWMGGDFSPPPSPLRQAQGRLSPVEGERRLPPPPFRGRVGVGGSVSDLTQGIVAVQPQVVWLCHPNNPTGSPFPVEVLPRLMEAAPGALFAVDEAYWTLTTDLPSALPHVAGGHVVVLRSLTKDFGLAGLRVGYALAAPRVAGALQRVLPPWNVSSLAQAAAVAALADPDHLSRARAAVAQSHAHLEAGLLRLGLDSYPGAANFLLVRVGHAPTVTRKLLECGCAVRDCTSFGLPDCLRIGVRAIPDQEVLLQALAQVIHG